MSARASEVVPGLYRIPVIETHGNIYILVRGGEVTIVDTGIPGKDGLVLEQLRSLGLKPRDVKAIVLTHFHIDHSGSAEALRATTGAKVYIHEDDAPYLQGLRPPPLPPEAPRETVEAYKWFRPVKPDVLLKDGDTVAGLKVIHVPGHTPGSIALYDGRLLFAGDNLNFVEGKIQGPPPQFSANYRQAVQAVRSRLLTLDFDVLLPGHGEPVVGRASDRARQDLKDLA